MSLLSRLKNSWNSRRLDADLAEEIESHIEERAAQLEACGLPPVEARRRARAKFGNALRLRETSRDARLLPQLEATIQDIHYALRGMRHNPGLTLTILASLALAIGATTTAYSIVDCAILRPLPVPHPEQLVAIEAPAIGAPGDTQTKQEHFSYPLYQQFRAAAGASARVMAFSSTGLIEIRNGSDTERFTRQYLTGDAFQVLGLTPALGRFISPQDEAQPVVVLSHDFWTHRFQSDPHILGRTLLFGDRPYSIIGVAPDGFFGIEPGHYVDVWLPSGMYRPAEALTNPGWNWLYILARKSPGTTNEAVASRLQPVFRDAQVQRVGFSPTMPEAIRQQFYNARLIVKSARNGISGFREIYAQPIWIVFGITATLLFIACANVASLLLARAIARAPEMAMRISLGAGRARILRQLLTESLLLSLAAAVLGGVFARTLAPLAVAALSKGNDPLRFNLSLNGRVLFFSFGVALITATIFGLAPAWQASATDPKAAVRGTDRTSGRLRLARLFVGAQVAFAFGLVIAGAAFLLSLRNLNYVDLGYDTSNVTIFNVLAPQGAKSSAIVALRDRVAAHSNINGASAAAWTVLGDGGWAEQIIVPGQTPSGREEILYPVSKGFFNAVHTPLLAGTDFSSEASDPTTTPTIVNEAFARRYFPNERSVIGKRFRHPSGRDSNNKEVPNVIIGLVGNTHYTNVRTPAGPMAYLPIDNNSTFVLYVRSQLPATDLARIVEKEVRATPGMRMAEVTTMSAMAQETLLSERLLAKVGGSVSFLALIIAAIGIFGILDFFVRRRTKDLGIHGALGATRSQLAALVLRETAPIILCGLAAGFAMALATVRLFDSILFDVHATTPAVLVAATATFMGAALVASLLPARRAALIDPAAALRTE